ncbi:InlB B-repeat-containing protein [Leadbettera azotonutricia]|uniref:Putative lipoprotein n=1 Tax=Leadbettera azotonutricia (strain ATCC BAA-888 / DSM 13862 / ZAS-9) TaxID=545695 RepID=F5Y760_LEAAZ|nr:lipoprotein [Leadbettera azotonutricia]AEF81497.1 putative lipoprotein [Leadbettera azotonutricia ZAS-9]
MKNRIAHIGISIVLTVSFAVLGCQSPTDSGGGKISTTYSVNIENLSHGSIIANPSKAEAGEKVYLIINPDPEHRLTAGSLVVIDSDNNEISLTPEGSSYYFNMPKSYVTVNALFEVIQTQTYNIEVASLANGSIFSNPTSSLAENTVSLYVIPQLNYKLKPGSLTVISGAVSIDTNEDNGVYTFTMPSSNVAVSAEFESAIVYVERHTIKYGQFNGGSVRSLSNEAAAGDTVYLIINAETNYRLTINSLTVTGSSGNVSVNETNGLYSFSMPDSDVTVNANFEYFQVQTYNVNISGTLTHGHIVSNPSTAAEGSVVYLFVEPNTGYQLSTGSLTVSGVTHIEGSGNIYFFTMPASNVTAQAQFELISVETVYTAAIADDLVHGTIKALPGSAVEGETVYIFINPETGYQLIIDSLTVTGSGGNALVDVSNGLYSFTMPGSEVTISAHFETAVETIYAVNIGILSGGKVTATPSVAAGGSMVYLMVEPDAGKQLQADSLKVSGTPPLSVSGGVYSFIMPASDVTVNASFEPIPNYSITSGALSNGAITVNPASAAENSTVYLFVTPDSGYRLKADTLKGTPATGPVITPTFNNGVYSFTMPASNVAIAAQFELIPIIYYTVNLGSIANGAITANPESARANSTVYLFVNPTNGYQLKANSLAVSGVAQINGSGGVYSFTMPTSNVTVSAQFEKCPYAVTVMSANTAYITTDKSIALMGDTVTLTVVPPVHKKLIDNSLIVSDSSGYITPVKVNDSKYTFTMPGSDVMVNSFFEPVYYIIAKGATDHGNIILSRLSAAFNDTVTGSVSPDAGYHFESISVTAGSETVTVERNGSDFSFIMPGSAVTVSAVFSNETVSGGTATVTITGPRDENIQLEGISGSLILSKTGSSGKPSSVTVTVADSSYTGIQWFVNNNEMETLPGSDSLLLKAADYPLTGCSLTVMVYKGEVPYTKILNFEVRE